MCERGLTPSNLLSRPFIDLVKYFEDTYYQIIFKRILFNVQIQYNLQPKKYNDHGTGYNRDDLYRYEGQIYSKEYIHNFLQLNCDFLLYNRLQNRIQLIMGNNQILPQDNIRPTLYPLYY